VTSSPNPLLELFADSAPDGVLLAGRLDGLPVVDMESAASVGRLRELIIDPRAHRVAGVIVSTRRRLAGAGDDLTVPADAVHFVGAHALTLRTFARRHENTLDPAAYPTRAALLGRRVLSWSGRVVGAVTDVLVDRYTGAIEGYVLALRGGWWLRFGQGSSGHASEMDYVRAADGVRVGPRLVVAPNSAVVRGARLSWPAAADRRDDAPGWSAGALPSSQFPILEREKDVSV
jgi:sporulation protein YlmC with PRC-barrel domain